MREQGGGAAPPPPPVIVSFVPNVNLTPQITGLTGIFTLPNTIIAGSSMVYRNGLRQQLGVDYVESSPTQITFPAPISVGQVLTIDYLIL